MALQLRKPILIGGLGLTVGAWVLNTLDPHFMHFADSAVWGMALLGSGWWWFKRQGNTKLDLTSLPPVDRATVDNARAQLAARIDALVAESDAANLDPATSNTIAIVVSQLRQRLTDITAGIDRKDIRLAVMGGNAVGKTTIVNLLKTRKPSTVATQAIRIPTSNSMFASGQHFTSADSSSQADGVDEPLSTSALTDAPEPTTAPSPSIHAKTNDLETADLVLFITTGDLTDSDYKAIEQLIQQRQRVLLLFNKQDRYLPDERPLILQQLRDRVQSLMAPDDVVAIAAQPASVIVRQQQPDGTIQERKEQPAPDMDALYERLHTLLTTQGHHLILATVLRELDALNVGVQIELNRLRRNRAMPIIEQYQWIAAAAAFANPVPSLDLLATASVTGQLVVDLGAIYQQTFSLEQAKAVMAELVGQMVKLGLVEVATQAISPLLKSHALTYIAGGTIQGLSAAYLTRLAGLSLVEYFEEQSLNLKTSNSSTFQVDRLVQKLKTVLQENQRSVFLQSLVKQGIGRLLPQSNQPTVPSNMQSNMQVSMQPKEAIELETSAE